MTAMHGPVVALDGPASSGKSSVGCTAAKRLGLRFVDTGLLYRAVTAVALREGIAKDDVAALVGLVPRIALADDGEGRLTRVLVDGAESSTPMHGPEVDGAVSQVARQAGLRSALLGRQRELAADGGIILAGRDIGTVVLPDADVKIYLDASAEERARRRIRERGLDPDGPEAAQVREQMGLRDTTDSTRDVAPLRTAADAIVIKTDGVTFEESVDLVVKAISAATRTPEPTRTARAATKVAAKAQHKPNRAVEIAMRMDDHQSLLVRTVAFVSRMLARVVARVKIEGIENLPPAGPVILAANHVSNADGVVLGAWLTPALKTRRIHWLGKREIFDIPVVGLVLASGGVHPVERGTADVDAFRLAMRILDAGSVLLIFPEGTRSPSGELAEAKDGTASLALKTGAQIVPIGINNSDVIWRKGKSLPSPFPRQTLTMRIGKPFRLADELPAGIDRRAAKAAATQLIMHRIAQQLDPRHRGAYAADAAGDEAPQP
jgi:cytidylate kinase